MTLKRDILQLLNGSPGLTDREITNRLRGNMEPQQVVNIACRQMAIQGLLTRERSRTSDNFIGNYPINASQQIEKLKQSEKTKVTTDVSVGHLSEDELKKILEAWLSRQGWKVQVAWGKQQGIDIEATRGQEFWIIEVKGPGSRQPMRVNYFLAILGELLQRMSHEHADYSIALPNIPQYRRLWDRLPILAKRRTKISLLLVSPEGEVTHLNH